MAQTVVDVVVKTSGAGKLDQLANQLKRTEGQFKSLQTSIERQGAANSLLKQKLTELQGTYNRISAVQAKYGTSNEKQAAKLRQLKAEIDKTKAALREGLQVNIRDKGNLKRLQGQLKELQGEFRRTEAAAKKSLGGVGASLQRLVAGAAIGDQLRRSFLAAADFSGTEARLDNLIQRYEQFAGIQQLAAQSAEKFGISQAQASNDLASLGSRLGASGANLQDLSDIYDGFNTLLATNALSAQEAASAQLQLNQALGSGRLAGDEFRSIAEATPQLLDKIAEQTGIARGELKQFAADGGLTAKILVDALREIGQEGGEELAKFFASPAGQLKLFEKAIKDFQVTVGQNLIPILLPVVEALGQMAKMFGQLPGPIQAAAVAMTALGASFAILGGPITAVIAGVVGITLVLKQLAENNQAFADGLKAAWDGILAALNGVGAFFQTFFGSITQQTAQFIQYWQGVGAQLVQSWNQGVAGLIEAWNRWQGYFNQVVEAIVNAWNQVVSIFPEAFGVAVNALGQTWNSFVQFLSNAFGSILEGFNSLLSKMGVNWASLINELIANVMPLTRVFGLLGIDIGEALVSGVESGLEAFQSFEGIKVPSLELPGVSGLGTVTPPGGAGGSGGGGGGGGGAGSGIDEAEKLAEAIAKASQEAKQLVDEFTKGSRPLKEQVADAEALVAALQGGQSLEAAQQEIDRARELNDIRLEGLQAIEELREIELLGAKELQEAEAAINEQVNERIANQQRLNDLKDQTAALTQQEAAAEQQASANQKAIEGLGKGLASDLAGGFKNILTTAIKGGDIKEAAMQLVDSLANRFLDFAFKQIEEALGKAFTGFLGGEEQNNLQKQQIVAQETQAVTQFGVHVQTFQAAVAQMGAMGGAGGGMGGFGGIGSLFSLAGSAGGWTLPAAATPLTGGIPFFAEGGRPPIGEVSLVGEKGPELVRFDRGATVYSNAETRQALDSRQSRQSQSDSNSAPQPAPILNMSFQTVERDGREYIDREQLEMAMAATRKDAARDGATAGHTRTMNALKNSRAQRGRIGI